MKISNIHIQNYRNIQNVNIEFNKLAIFIGDNNSGKSNFLRAITLPFFNDEIGMINKNLGWQDINNQAKSNYFNYIENNIEKIKNEQIKIDEFIKYLPVVKVKAILKPYGADEYYVHKWINSIDGETPTYSIEYQYFIDNPKDLLDHITKILKENDNIYNIKMNLLPIEMYKYKIIVPLTGEEVTYSDLLNFKYNSLAAERDEFLNRTYQLGSRTLVKLLNNKLSKKQKVEIEKSYEKFFEDLKEISKIEGVFNWQEHSEIENAKDFFDKITLLPNMPSMNSLLNNVRLGYGEDYLNNQGLGYRNLIYLLVMLNSLIVNSEIALNILTIEEPEAHLCNNNKKLLTSFINSIISSNNQIQVFLSTHSSEIINKLQLDNVSIFTNGNAFALKSVIDDEQLDYLMKIPNIDFLKFLFSRNCILVEGPSEELLIKSYLNIKKNELNDIEVISFHKGFTKILDIWLKVNKNSSNRIGIIRDYDNQPNAQDEHEKYNKYNNIYVTTTTEYTLEPEFVKTSNNFEKMKKYFTNDHDWVDIDSEEKLSDKWRNAKADTMLKFCKDFGKGDLTDIDLPQHIKVVLDFLQSSGQQ